MTLLTFMLLAQSGNWPEFRANGGIAQDNKPPLTWSEKKNVRWKTAIHGKGWSSPVVWNKSIWLTTAPEDGTRLSAICVDLESGKILHDKVVFEVEDPEFCHPTNSYASCSPAIEEGRVYIHFGTYGTACLDSSSYEVIWQRRDLECDHFRGPASSPIIHKDLLIVNFDGVDVQYVVALDKMTGKTKWKKNRSTDYGNVIGDMKKAYSTPMVYSVGDREIVVSPGAIATIAYDLQTGDEIWKVRHGGMNAGTRPVFANDLIYLCAGADKNALVVLPPTAKGMIAEKDIVWRSGRNVPQKASPIVHGELMFMVSDNGVASCLNAKTGESYWRERIKAGTYWASPILAGGRVYCFSQEGHSVAVAADKSFKVLATNELDTGCNATPAVIGDSMIIRTKTHLYRIEGND